MKFIKRISPHTWANLIKITTAALGFIVVFMLFQINAQNKQIAEKATAIAMQNQHTAKDSKSIAEQNQRHIDCIANLFARFTRDNQPITIEDLDTCQAIETPIQASSSSIPTTTPELGNQTKTNTIENNTSQSSNTKTTDSGKKDPLEILGIKICLPITEICIRK